MNCGHGLWRYVAGGLLLAGSSWAQTLSPVSSTVLQTIVSVQTRHDAPDLHCGKVPAKPRAAPVPDADPHEVPDEDEVQSQLSQFQETGPASAGMPDTRPSVALRRLWSPLPGQPLRVGVWGDSHLAAGFWSQELQRLTQLPAQSVRSRFMPASINRPGVRLPFRKTCTGPQWQYEPAHAVASGAADPGPGLVNMFTRHNEAWLSWDMRNAMGLPDKRQVRLMYQQTRTPITLAIRVDGGDEQRLDLQGREGPAVLDLVGDEPISTVQLRVAQGPFRLHGLEWPLSAETRLQLDVFGYPGATVAGWRQIQAADLAPWWGASPYDVVMLAFGTNEGNVQPFDASAYAQMLQASVGTWRQAFPEAACLLVAPGDRGILVRRSQKNRSKPGQVTPSDRSRTPDLLKFTRVHAEIGRIQKQVAQAHGCYFWSMLDAMGGAGSAYRWAQQNPAWMARDLIHFTVPGYQRLAQLMAQDLGWNPSVFSSVLKPARRD